MEFQYGLSTFYHVEEHSSYALAANILSIIQCIDNQIIPLVEDKKNTKDSTFMKPMIVSKSKSKVSKIEDKMWEREKECLKLVQNIEGVEKWIQDIRSSLNKLSNKNYDNQLQIIVDLLNRCLESDNLNSTENVKKIASSIFSVASTNMFYAEIYAKLYKQLIENNKVFEEILYHYLSTFVNSIKELTYVDPDTDYEKFCHYNKLNDMRKATVVFVVQLMKQQVVPVLCVLNIMISFQELAVLYVEDGTKINEVEEITEVMFLFLQEGKKIFQESNGEWVWKFVLVPHITTFSKYTKKEKKGFSSRAIFKYMDMAKMIGC